MSESKQFSQLTLQQLQSLYPENTNQITVQKIDILIGQYSGQQLKLAGSQQNQSLPQLMIQKNIVELWYEIKQQIPNGESTYRIVQIQLIQKLYQIIYKEDKEFKQAISSLQEKYNGLMKKIGLEVDEAKMKDARKMKEQEGEKNGIEGSVYLLYANVQIKQKQQNQENKQKQEEQKKQQNQNTEEKGEEDKAVGSQPPHSQQNKQQKEQQKKQQNKGQQDQQPQEQKKDQKELESEKPEEKPQQNPKQQEAKQLQPAVLQQDKAQSQKQISVQQIFTKIQSQQQLIIPTQQLQIINKQLQKNQQKHCQRDQLSEFKDLVVKNKSLQGKKFTFQAFRQWRKQGKVDSNKQEQNEKNTKNEEEQIKDRQKIQAPQENKQKQQDKQKEKEEQVKEEKAQEQSIKGPYLIHLFKKYFAKPEDLRQGRSPNQQHSLSFKANLGEFDSKQQISTVRFCLSIGKQPQQNDNSAICIKLQSSTPQFLKADIDMIINQNQSQMIKQLVKTVVKETQVILTLQLKQFKILAVLQQISDILNQNAKETQNNLQINTEISLAFPRKKSANTFLQNMLQGFNFMLGMNMNAQLSQIMRKNVQRENCKHYQSRILTLLVLNKKSQVKMNFKQISEVEKFIKKLGLNDIIKKTPLVQELIFDMMKAFLLGNIDKNQNQNQQSKLIKDLLTKVLSSVQTSYMTIEVNNKNQKVQTQIISQNMKNLLAAWLK